MIYINKSQQSHATYTAIDTDYSGRLWFEAEC